MTQPAHRRDDSPILPGSLPFTPGKGSRVLRCSCGAMVIGPAESVSLVPHMLDALRAA